MRIHRLLVLCALLNFVMAARAFAGHDQGNGADTYSPSNGSAWFVDAKQPLRACMEVAPYFGPSSVALKQKIESAYQRWIDYIKEKQISTFSPPKLVIVPSCTLDTDLKFLFGVEDADVATYKSKFSNPVSFSVRTAYDPLAGWGRGFVWFALPGALNSPTVPMPFSWPDWTVGANLEMILLHELGQVFGIGHIEGTVMAENIAASLALPTGIPDPARQREIDKYAEIASCKLCETKTSGQLGVKLKRTMTDAGGTHDESVDTEADIFRILIRRAPKGTVRATVETVPTRFATRLIVSDSEQSQTFPIVTIEGSRVEASLVPVFRIYRESNGGNGAIPSGSTTWANHESATSQAFLQRPDGSRLAVNVLTNVTARQRDPHPSEYSVGALDVLSPLTLTVFDHGEVKVLYTSHALFSPH